MASGACRNTVFLEASHHTAINRDTTIGYYHVGVCSRGAQVYGHHEAICENVVQKDMRYMQYMVDISWEVSLELGIAGLCEAGIVFFGARR